jgi:phosphoenolpyruvate-protein phosphotransferase
MKKGIPVSPGVAVGRAYCIQNGLDRHEPSRVDAADLSGEVSRFINACAAAGKELDAIVARVSLEMGEDEANIFRAHRMLVRDPALIGKVKTAILNRQVDATTALQEALDDYARLIEKIEDDYLRERMADLRDVAGRIMNHLGQLPALPAFKPDESMIIVAPEILPSQAMALDRLHIAGIITETGGGTGHAAILARSLGIPAISGLSGILKQVETGDLVAMDGREGHVYLKPGPEVESAFRKLQREYFDLRDRLIENRDQAPVTCDGLAVELLANVNSPADATMAVQVGASGVGLYRTEYLFLANTDVPDEEQQLAAYRQVIEASPNKHVTIRTLDLGGDKHVPYLGNPHEANPFLGWRSIRLSSAYPELFQTQLRAILRAGLFGKVSLLFPMISTLEEVRALKQLVSQTQAALKREKVPYAENMSFGIMLEVPAAALCIDALLDEVDFVSIGSNDLIQYVMAADRDNPKVAHLCEPFSPAIMRLLASVIKACNDRGKPVTLCGEMAARPRLFLPLFGMGLRSMSMSPAFVPAVKELVRCSTLKKARGIARKVLGMKTFDEVRDYLTKSVHDTCPNVSLLDIHE